MKKFIRWVKSPSSDLVLFIIVLALANMVGQRAFLRFDLTGSGSYSLSPASRQLVRTIRQPLSVKVFFSRNLPSPYNTVEQYVQDLLIEYKGAANKNFSYTFFDMDKQKNQDLAAEYGLQQTQIQELKSNEVGFKQAWMGLAVVYTDSIERVDSITSTDGLEYKLTTTISKMIAAADALAGLPENERVKMTLYLSGGLSKFQISGLDKLETEVRKVYDAVNRKNGDRIEFANVDPDPADIPALNRKYGIQTISWKNDAGVEGSGALGLVLEYRDAFRVIPLSMLRTLFGYAIAGLDSLESSIGDGLQSLMVKPTEIGYVTNHDELNPNDPQNGAGNFHRLVSDMYTLKKIDLAKDEIPASLASIVINGPKREFSDEELYKIDQFILRGGNVLFFIDPFQVVQGGYYQPAQYIPLDTRIGTLLKKYGVKLGTNYVMDERCYTANQKGYGKLSLPWAPLLQKDSFDGTSAITKNLGYVIFLQNSSIDVKDAEAAGDRKVTVLAKSSPKSWLMEKNISLNPLSASMPPDAKTEKSEALAVLVEGRFKSAFESDPTVKPEGGAPGNLSSSNRLSKSVQPGKIFVVGSSELTGPRLIDENGSEPVALFVRNAVDYMNGAGDFCAMRTKGLSLNALSAKNGPAVLFAQIFNEFGLTALTALLGLWAWRVRIARRRRIRELYNPDDSRETAGRANQARKG